MVKMPPTFIAPEGLLCRAAIKIDVRTFVSVCCLLSVLCLSHFCHALDPIGSGLTDHRHNPI